MAGRRRSAGRLDGHGIGGALDDPRIVRGQARAARLVADHAKRARAEFGVDDPKFVRLARRRLRRNGANRQLLLVEIDGHREGGRGRVLLQDRHILMWRRPPARLASDKSNRQHPSDDGRGDRGGAPAPDAALKRDNRRTSRRFGRRASKARLDRGEKVARRLDLRRGFRERRQALLPGADRLVELGLAQPPRGQRRPLARIERAERIFGGGEVVVGRDRHDARQSLSCARLRWSQVLIVGTGRPKRLASASRLRPR